MHDHLTIYLLLGIIAFAEILRLWLTYKPVTKKSYFKNRLEQTKKLIYDLEFKIFKTREIREEVRVEYTQTKARLEAVEQQFKTTPNDKKLEDQKVILTKDAQRYEAQLGQLDIDVDGSKPTNEYPNGIEGISQQIDQIKEVQGMLKSWIKGI